MGRPVGTSSPDLQYRDQIIDGIEYWLTISLSSYSEWTIGISGNPNRRSAEFQRAGIDIHRRYWEAADEGTARSIESYFLERGMRRDDGGGTEERCFVYIF